jgi:hypothetical protein
MIAHGRLSDLDTVLIDQPPPHTLGRVTLLARRLQISDQPPIDDLAKLPQLRRAPARRRALGRRQRRRQRLPHRPAMHAVALCQRPDRQALPVAITPDLLELLHSGSHSLRPRSRAR